MAAPLLLAGLSLLPKIPNMWNAVANLFGKKAPKTITEAGKLASSVMDAFKKGELTPEAQVELEKIITSHEEVMARIALEEKELEFKGEELIVTDLTDVRDLEKQSYKSDDEYVRRTRPKILRDFFKLTAAYVLYAPLAVIAAHSVGMNVVEFIPMLKWIGGFLFSTFGTSYLGYTGARLMDKRDPNFKNGSGVLNKLVKKMV